MKRSNKDKRQATTNSVDGSSDKVATNKTSPSEAKIIEAGSGKSAVVGYVFMLLLAIQYGFQPFLTSKFSPPSTNKTLVVFAQEAVKAMYISVVIVLSGRLTDFFSPTQFVKGLKVAAPPAGIYALQNWCTQLAYHHLDSVAFNCLNQTKLISTALCVYIMFGKKQSRMQVLALCLLIFSAVLLQSSSSSASTETPQLSALSQSEGVAAILTASLLSGIAAALCQQALQSTGALELTLSMSLVTFVLLSASLLVSPDGRALLQAGGEVSFAPSVAIPVCTNAAGGIFVAQVTRHLGGVEKGFSVVGGLVLTGVLQSYVNQTILPFNVLTALVLVTCACGIHSLFPYVSSKDKTT